MKKKLKILNFTILVQMKYMAMWALKVKKI